MGWHYLIFSKKEEPYSRHGVADGHVGVYNIVENATMIPSAWGRDRMFISSIEGVILWKIVEVKVIELVSHGSGKRNLARYRRGTLCQSLAWRD